MLGLLFTCSSTCFRKSSIRHLSFKKCDRVKRGLDIAALVLPLDRVALVTPSFAPQSALSQTDATYV